MNRLERMQSTTTSPSTLSAAHSQRTSNSPSFGSIKPNDSPILMTPHSDSQQPCGDIAQIPLPITQLPPASAPINFSDRSPGEMSQSLFESSLLSAGARRNSKYQRVKLKIHEPQRNETRALVISDYNGGCIQPFRLILERISGKFGVDLKRQSIALRYLDEDGEPISIADDEDLELAITSVCEGSALHLTLLVE
jgi:hypothetical protein